MTTTDPTRRGGHPAPPAAPSDLPPPPNGPGPGADPTATAPQPAPLDLDLIEARCDAATAAPWWAWDRGVGWRIALDQPDDEGNPTDYLPDGMRTDIARPGDARFIAAARTDIPALVAEVRRLRAELVNEQAAHTKTCANFDDFAEGTEGTAGQLRDARRQVETWRGRALGAEALLHNMGARRDADGAWRPSPAEPDGFRRERAILHWAADRLEASGNPEWRPHHRLRRWADELDAAPAAPRTYQLPAQPDGPLWDNIGRRWDRSLEGGWQHVMGKGERRNSLHLAWHDLLDFVVSLSTVPPAGTEGERG